jgi:hypothetical protein
MLDRKKFPTEPKNIKVDDLLAIVHYVKVKTVHKDGEELMVEDVDLTGKIIRVQGSDLISKSLSADQFTEETKISKMQAAEILIESHNKPFTVNFVKVDGSERTLRGRLIRPEPLLGRSMVEDLDEVGSNKMRQVDHRTINWLIVDGVKYVVK